MAMLTGMIKPEYSEPIGSKDCHKDCYLCTMFNLFGCSAWPKTYWKRRAGNNIKHICSASLTSARAYEEAQKTRCPTHRRTSIDSRQPKNKRFDPLGLQPSAPARRHDDSRDRKQTRSPQAHKDCYKDCSHHSVYIYIYKL